LDLSL